MGDGDLGPGGPGVADHVGQRLLHHPVAGQVDGRGTGTGRADGHGIAGMRERAALYGGSLDAGPLPGGGFRVAARLPVGPGLPA